MTSAPLLIIRGINATAEPTPKFRTKHHGNMNIGNSPINGYFQLDDLKQVECRRIPGTLYSTHASAAPSTRPNDPGRESPGWLVRGGRRPARSRSSGTGYALKAMVNVPIADTLAFRASAKYAYEPGFVNVYGLLHARITA